MSYLLRHGAVKEGLKIGTDGYVNAFDLVNHPQMAKIESLTLKQLKRLVETNEKKRYELTPGTSDNLKDYYIRAA